MIAVEQILKGHKTAESRWARFGPYYAMFPVDFAFEVVEKYSKEGVHKGMRGIILDPRCIDGQWLVYFDGEIYRNAEGVYGTTEIDLAVLEEDLKIIREG